MSVKRSSSPALVALVGVLAIALVAFGARADVEEPVNDEGVPLLDDDGPFVAFFDDLSDRISIGIAVEGESEPTEADVPSPAVEVADPIADGDTDDDADALEDADEVAGVVIEAEDLSEADAGPTDQLPQAQAGTTAVEPVEVPPRRGARNLTEVAPGS